VRPAPLPLLPGLRRHIRQTEKYLENDDN